MHPLLLHGFGTSVRVNGRTLEIDWRSEGRKESYRPQQLPFDSLRFTTYQLLCSAGMERSSQCYSRGGLRTETSGLLRSGPTKTPLDASESHASSFERRY